MRVLSRRIGELPSHFDKNGDFADRKDKSSLKQMFIEHQISNVKKRTKSGQLASEHIFGFCKTFQKNTKGLGFQITLKTRSLQDKVHTTLSNNKTVNVDNINLFVPLFLPDDETQSSFTDSIKSSFTLSLDEWVFDRRVFEIGLE